MAGAKRRARGVVKPWTQEEFEYMRAHYPTETSASIGAVLGRTKSGVNQCARRLGLLKTEEHLKRHGTAYRHKQLVEVESEIIARYSNESSASIAASLGLTLHQIGYVQKRYKLRKSLEYKRSLAEKSNLVQHGAKYAYKKGNVPWCAGKKIGTKGRSGDTQFKKGHTPAGTLPVGTRVVNSDGYLYEKVSMEGFPKGAPRPIGYTTSGRWRAVHHILWEQAGRTVPEGYALAFKNGDKSDVRLENIRLVSRQDIVLLHHGIEDDEIFEADAALYRLKRAIKEKRNGKDNH